MFWTADEIEAEIRHQRDLLRQYTSNLRYVENQIAQFEPALVPVYKHNEHDSIEAERTKVLQKIQDLEQQLHAQPQQQGVPPARVPEVNVQLLLKTLPTGVLHLYSREKLPLLKYGIANPPDKPRSVIVTSWIEQFSYTRSDTVHLEPGQSTTVLQLPILKLEEIVGINEVRKAVLHTRASYLEEGQEAPLFLQDHDIRFLARDTLIWAIIVDEDTVQDLSHQVAAWVTPNADPVVEMLRHAADHAPAGQMWGYQGGDNATAAERAAITRVQVKAVFEALQQEGQITYVNAPISFGQKANEIAQRISLPADSLAHRQANCIDGAVLYASLIERAGMNPVIVLVPGHAFAGWETWDRSKQHEFLETTMTGNSTFEQAWTRGMEEYEKVKALVGRPLFDENGYAVLLDVPALHRRGILPPG